MSGGKGTAARAVNDVSELAAALTPVVQRAVRVATEDIALDAQAAALLAGKRLDASVVLAREEMLVVAARRLGGAADTFEGLDASDFADPTLRAVWTLLDAGATDEMIARALGASGHRGADILAELGAVRLLWGEDVRAMVLDLIAASRWRRFVGQVLVLNAELHAKAGVGQAHAMAGVRDRLRSMAADVGPALRATEGER